MAIYTDYTLLAKEYTSVDPDFEGVFYWNDGEGYKEYVVDQNAFTSFTEALYAGYPVYGFSGSYTANNVVNNYGATLTSDALTIAWNAENNRFEATATPTEEPTTLTIKTRLTNNANTDFIVGSGVSISGSNNNPAAIVNDGTFIVNTNRVVNANFTGNGKIVLTGTAFDSGFQIAGVNNIDIANAATFTGSSLEGTEIKVLQTTDETPKNQNLVLNGATLKAETLTVTGYFYVLGDSSVSATTAASANSKKIYLGKSGNTAEVTLRDSTIVPGAGNLTGVELYHKEGTTAATTANILGKNDIATQIRSNSGTLNIGSATGDKTYLKSASILSFYDNAVGTTSINVNNAVLGVAEGNEVVADKKVSFTQYAGVITIENSVVVASSISAKNNRYFQIKGNSSLDVASLSGTITIIDGATLTKSAIAGADGKVSIESGKTVTFAGANSILSAIDNNGTILLAKDGEKAPKLTVNTISGNITVAEGAVDVTTTPAWVIKGTVNPGEGKVVTVPASTYAAIVDSGLYITKENVDTLFVDGGYGYGTDGSAITTDNHILGYNAFKSLADLTFEGPKDGTFVNSEGVKVQTASTVSLATGTAADYSTASGAAFFFANNANGVTFVGKGGTAEEKTAVKIITDGYNHPLYLMGAVTVADEEGYWSAMKTASGENYAGAQKFAIDGSLELTIDDLRVGLPLNYDDFDGDKKPKRQAGVGNLTINGTVKTPTWLVAGPLSKISVSDTGKVISENRTILNAASALEVTGSAAVKDATGYQFTGGDLQFINGSSTATFKDSKVKLAKAEGVFVLDGWSENVEYATVNKTPVEVTFDGTTLDVTSIGNIFAYNTADVGGDIANLPKLNLTFKNGSVATASNSALNLAKNSSVTVNVGAKTDDTGSNALSVKSISNRGTINVYAGSSITVTDSFTNTGSGNITILGNADNRTFKSIDAQKGIANSAAFSITDAFVNVSGDDFYNTTGGNLTIKNSLIKTNGGFALTSYAGTTTVYGSTINAALRIDGGVFTIGAGTSTLTGTLYGTSHTVNLANDAVLKDSNVQKLNTTTGKFVVADSASVEFSGTNTLSATITNNGTITINAGSSISANSIAGGTIALVTDDTVADDKATLFVTADLTTSHNTYFTVNGVDAFADAEALAAFYTGDIGSVAVAAAEGKSAYTLRRDGNKYSLIKTPSKETLYVGTADALADPTYVLGYNAFYNLADALVEAYKESSVTTTIKLLDKTSTTGVDATIGKKAPGEYLTLKNNLTITSDATTAVTATIGFANGDYGLMLNPADAADGALVIDKTIATEGGAAVDSGAIYLNMKGVSKGSITVNGALETTSRIKIYGKTTVNGSLSAGEFVWVKAGAQAAAQEGLDVATSGLTINGAVNTGRFYFASGVVTATNTATIPATITAESFYFGQHVGGELYITENKEFVADETGYKAVLNSTGAIWNFSRDFSAGSTDDIRFNGEFNFDGGAINVHTTEPEAYKTEAWDGAEAGTVKIGALVTLNLLNDATMTVGLNDGTHDFAGSVTNAGAINLKNGAELEVNGAVSNTGAINLEEEAQLEVSGAVSNTGAIKVGKAGNEKDSDLIAGSFENSGTIDAQADSTIKANAASTNKAGATINIGNKAVSAEDNDGIAISASAATLDVSGDFTNNGTVNVYTSGSKILVGTKTIKNTNQFTVDGAAKIQAGQINNSGKMKIENATIDLYYGQGISNTSNDQSNELTIKNSSVTSSNNPGQYPALANWAGVANIEEVSTFKANIAVYAGTVNVTGSTITGNVTVNAGKFKATTASAINGKITNKGTFTMIGGSITGSTVANTGTFGAENVSLTSNITNSGTFTMIGGSITGSTVANTGTFNASGDLALNIEKFSGTITLNDTATITNSTATSFVDTTAGAGAIETTAGKTVTFVGANTFADAAFTNNGTITIGSNAATASLTTGAFTNKGTITINGSLTTGTFTNGVKTTAGTTPGTITVNGSLTAGDIANTYGTITIDANDTITATKIAGGSIILDTTKLYADSEAKTITLISGLTANMSAKVYANSAESANVISSGDVIELKDSEGNKQHYRVSGGSGSKAMTLYKVDGQPQDNLYVKSTYNDTTAAADGLVFGYNAFANLVTALNVAKDVKVADNEKVNVLLGNDTSITKQGMLFLENEFQSNTVIGLGQKAEGTSVTSATATIGFKAGDYGLMLNPAAGKNIKIDSGVTLKTTAANGNTDGMCGTVYLNYKGTTGTVTVDGNIQSATDIYFCGAATVNGNLTVGANIGQLLLRAGKANVAPEGDADPVNKSVVIGRESGNNETAAQVKGTWVVLISGDAEFNNTVIDVTALGYDNYTNDVKEYQSTPTLTSNNSTWTIGEISLAEAHTPTTRPDLGLETIPAEFNFNNSTVNVDGTVNLGSFITMNLADGSKLTAGAITNNGTFKATTAIVDGTVTNNGTFTANGATLGSITTNAESNALASLTFEGADSTATYIKNRGGTITINANLTVSGNFETAALSGKPSITELNADKTLTANLLLNGATFNATDATIDAAIKNSGTINATNTTLSKSINNSTAGAVFNAIDTALDGISITNSGTFTVKDSSKTLNVTVTGNAIELDKVTLTDAKVVGEATVVGDSTLNGGEFTTLNVAADKKLDVIGGKLTATTVTATGALTLKNKASIDVATIDNLVLDGGVYTTAGDDANLKIGSAAALKLDGAMLNDVTLNNVSFEVEKVLDDSEEPVVIASSFTGINSIGSLTVDEGAALTISAAATIADLETLSLTVNGKIVNNGTITIDATGLEWGGSLKSMKVIGITDGTITSPGTISVTGVDKTMAIVKDDGIYLFKVQAEVDTETLYVNSDWSTKKPGDSFKYAYVDAAGETVTVDCVFGVNAFANTANLVQYDDTTALVVESSTAYGDLNWGKDVTMTLSNGDATFGAVTFGAGATIYGGFTATSLSVTGAAAISGDVTTTAALSVTGNAAFGGNVTAGATTLGDVTVAGNLTTAALTVGDAVVTGNVTANGDVALNGVTKIDGTLSSTNLDLADGASLNMAWNKDQTATIAVTGNLSAGEKSFITIDVFNGGLETVTTNKTVISAGSPVDYTSIVSNYDASYFTIDGNDLVLDAVKIAKVSKSYTTEVPAQGKYNSISHAVSNENTGLILIVDGNFGNASLNDKQTRVRTSGTMGNTDPTKGSYLAGGFNVAKKAAETESPLAVIFDNYKQDNGSTSVTIENGVFNNAYVVGADMIQLATNEKTVTFFRTGNSNLTINGGSFTAPVDVNNGKYGERAIVGGMLYNIAGSSSEARLIGDVALTITGGTFEGYNVYGGNYALGNKFLGLNTSIRGNVTLTLDATTNALAFTANAGGYGGFVQAGSFGPSKISKNTEVILKGSKGITFEQLVGGSSSDEHLWDAAEEKWTCNSCVDGNRTLTFSGFSGELDFGKVQDFNVVSFEGENEVNFEGEFHRYFNDDVTTWKFAADAAISGNFAFDFTGDTVDLTDFTNANAGWELSNVTLNETTTKFKFEEGVALGYNYDTGAKKLTIISTNIA